MRTVSADRAFRHVEELLAEHPGLTRNHIFHLAGTYNVMRTDRQRTGRISPENEERLLAVTSHHLRLLPPRHVPKQPVLAHVDSLLALGPHVSLSQIGKSAGISYQTMYNLRSGKHEFCRWTTYAALMAVTPEDVESGTYWRPRKPAETMLRALQANGWSRSVLNEMLGKSLVGTVLRGYSEVIQSSTYAQVKALYDRLGDEPGPSTASRNHAARMGFKTPIHYDDDMNLIEAERETEEDVAQREARIDLCILAQSIEPAGRPIAAITESLGTYDRRVSTTRRLHGLKIERDFVGNYIAVDAVPGAIAAIRRATRGIHYRSTLDVLDDPGLDYVALLGSIAAEVGSLAAA